MSNTHNLEIDVDLKENLIITATCKQLDDLNLTFNVWNNGEMVDLSEYKCRLKAFKQDQIPLIQNTSININNNVVNIIADEQFTTTSGTVKVELQFINKNTGKKKSTFNIIFKVMQSVLEVERSISKATCTLLKEIDYKLDQIEDIKLDIIEAVKVKNDLNTSRTDANNMNNTLKTTTTNADNKKKEVETSINNASNKIKEVQDSTNAANTAKQAVDNSVISANSTKQALDTSKVNADITKKEVDAAIIVADEKIEIIKKLDPENVVEDVKKLKEQVLENTYTKLETDSTLTKLDNCENSFVHNMQIKGKTLQNLWNGGSVNYLSSENRLIETTTLDLYKPNTDYTIINYNNKKIKLGIFTKANTYSRSIEVLPNSKFIIRLNDEIIKDKVGEEVNGWANSDNDKNELKKSIVILEGEVKEIPPYFEGIQSTGEIEGNKISILSCGKNLIKNGNGENGLDFWIKRGNITFEKFGEFTGNQWTGIDQIIKVKQNTDYTVSCKHSSNSGVYVMGIKSTDGNTLTFNTGNNNQVTVSLQNKIVGSQTVTFAEFQLEEGTISKQYEPYKTDKTEILISSPHMGLPNGIGDVIDYEKNERIKNVQKAIFNGSEGNWSIINNTKSNTILFRISVPDLFIIANNYTLLNCICNKFALMTATDGWLSDTKEGICQDPSDRTLRFNVLKSKLETPDVAGFKKLLKTWADAGTPLEVCYQLATPVKEKLDIKDTLQSFENGYIQLNNAITPCTQLEYSTNIPSAIGGLTQITDKLIDDVTNVEITISDLDAEIGEARKDKNTLEERLEEDRTNILKTIGQVKDMSMNVKTDNNYEGYDVTKIYTWTKTGTYLTKREGVIDLPSGWNQGRYEVITFDVSNSEYSGQIIFGDPYNKKMAFRYGLNADSKWKQLATVDDTGWITLPLIPPLVGYGDSVIPKYRKINNIVEVRGAIKGLKTINPNTGLDFSTLPAGFRPKHTMGVVCQGSRLAQWYLTVSSSGVLNIDRYSEDGSTLKTEFNGLEWLPFQIMFSVD
ncbi:hypothetical protein FDC27_08830 [Clostridium botulinum]|nr:hypothetical protein [Clostridium botulinum]NFO67062.1 hypothetical protein [Clostridium botulinum]